MSRTKSKAAEPRKLSDKQLAANRANAAKSTGPRTLEGKARSSQNAVKHGFTSSNFTISRFEDIDEIDRLKQDVVSCYRPVNSQELFACERIAIAQQVILRAARLESGLFVDMLDDTISRRDLPFFPLDPELIGGNIPVTRAQNRNFALADGFRDMARESKAFPLLLRYQAQAERQYRRAIEDFERLKALRPELPNEPIWQSQPEDKPQLATPEELNIDPREIPGQAIPAEAPDVSPSPDSEPEPQTEASSGQPQPEPAEDPELSAAAPMAMCAAAASGMAFASGNHTPRYDKEI